VRRFEIAEPIVGAGPTREGIVMSQPDGGGSGSGARMSGGAIASLTGVVVLIIFMIQNTEDVTLHFLVWSFTWPLWLFTLVLRRHRRRKARREDRRN
jgi:uncharacterized integral membrane protein